MLCGALVSDSNTPEEKPRITSEKSEAVQQNLPPRTWDLEPAQSIKLELGGGNIHGACQR